jgi:hypothetical protein
MITAYLNINLSMSFDFVRRCFAKDAIPEIFHLIDVFLLEVLLGVVLGHVKLNPVGKNDSLELFQYWLRKRIGAFFTHGGLGHLNFVLNQQ